jgi:ABC-type sugar transport system substrate-binding protein
MKITRRTLLTSAVLAAAAATEIGRAAADSLRAGISLRIFDSRSSLSRAWRGSRAEGAIDVAQEQANRWLNLRSITPHGRVAGLTAWSDFVQARGVLEQKGLRLRTESRSGRLFYWEMV